MEIPVGPDLKLRTLVEADAPELFSLVDRNRAYLRRWLPWLDGNVDEKASLLFIRSQTKDALREESIPFAVLHEQRLAGVLGCNWIDLVRRACGLGYWISESLQGRGIVTRSVGALIEHAFGHLGLETIEIHVATGNPRSRCVAERLGFQMGEVRENAEWLYDHHVDHVVYRLARAITRR